MSVNRTVKIADLEHEVKFPSRIRICDDINRATDKSLWEAFASGQIRDQAAVIWAGLKHANKKLTVEKVLDLMQEHEDNGGDCSDVVRQVFAVAFEDQLFGPAASGTDYNALRRMFSIPEVEPGKAQG